MALFARWALPAVLLLAALGLYRLAYSHVQPPVWNPASKTPARIGPLYDWPEVATDEQLRVVLERMQPPAAINSNKWLHALRLWGPKAEFAPIPPVAADKPSPQRPSGRELLAYFLDDNAFRARNGETVPPLFRIGPDGIEAREVTFGDKFNGTAAAHRDDVLATFAESNVPLDTPLVTRDGTTTVEQLLRDTYSRYHPHQHEYEWSIISYLRYLYPQDLPTNRYGERIRLADMVDEIVDAPLLHGICAGLHRMEAAVLLWRLDEQHHALPPAARAKLANHLLRVRQILTQSQQVEGMWTRAWPDGAAAAKKDKGNRYDQLLATGHVLEYLALAPQEFQPPRESIVRAGQWLARAVAEEDPATLEKNYGPFTHAARALSLWRKQEAWDAWQRLNGPAASDTTRQD
jgi:hypothetical protein